jgi:hypothetical protein
MPSTFEAEHPSMTRWVKTSGRIEIGYDARTNTFVRAIDEGGMIWGGRSEDKTIDEALRDTEREMGFFAYPPEKVYSRNQTPMLGWTGGRSDPRSRRILRRFCVVSIANPFMVPLFLSCLRVARTTRCTFRDMPLDASHSMSHCRVLKSF